MIGSLLVTGCAFTEPIATARPGLTGPLTDQIDTDLSLALFRSPDRPVWLVHVHVSFPRSRLFFRQRQTGSEPVWRAEYEWRVIIRERNALQRGGGVYVGTVELDEEALTSDPAARIRLFRQFRVPPGTYRVEVILSDRNSTRSGRQQREVRAVGFEPGQPGLSQIEMLDPGRELRLGPAGDVAAAHAAEVVASRRNPESARTLAFLYETYAIPEGTSMTYRLISEDGDESRSRSMVLTPGSNTVRDTLDVSGLGEGRYSLQLRLDGPGEVSPVKRLALRIQRPLLADGDDLREAVAQMSLVVGERSSRVLTSLDADGRRAFIDSVWTALDPTPGTGPNEARMEFRRRLRFADERWRTGSRRGWEVDIGRIYIAWGEPDEIIEERRTRTPTRTLEGPDQILVSKWIYHDPAVTFVFINESERGWILDRERSDMIPPVREDGKRRP